MSKSAKLTALCDLYEGDLYEFAKYVNPGYMYGEIHEEVYRILQEDDINLLLLLPRGHLKSHCIATWVAWTITKEPWTTVVYLTSGKDLAQVQMYAIKQIFQSQRYKDLWPEMFNNLDSEKDKYSSWAINTDHPKRKEYGIRDYTLVMKTIKSSSTGLHCDYLVYDDLVTPKNAYTKLGRSEVEMTVADFTSIKNTGSKTKAVGTRYHLNDIYGQWEEGTVLDYNEDTGEIIGEHPLFTVINKQVENAGDGTGSYLWPRIKCPKTKRWFGFNLKELALKKAEMITAGGNMAHFYSQYYNMTSDPDSMRTSKDSFQRYKIEKLRYINDTWYINDEPLKLGIGMDLAFSEASGSKSRIDYTAIAIIGITPSGFIYVLDLDQFRTDKFSIYYEHLVTLYLKWHFHRMYLDVSGSGKVVKRELEKRIREDGYSLAIRGVTYSHVDGAKEERFAAVVEPRYDSSSVYHYDGGLIPELEEQITNPRPLNDDLEDAMFIALDNTRVPMITRSGNVNNNGTSNVVIANNRFGGRRRAS